MSGWGKPKYGNDNNSKTARIKEGDNLYRLLPPMLSFAEEGKWSNYVTVHFGYAGTDPSDSTKTKQKPFRCIEVKDFRTSMILEDCPECDLYEVNKKSFDDREAELKTQYKAEGKDEKEIEELLASALGPDVGWLKAHRPDRKHYMNAMTPDGKEFVQVAISHRTKKQLDAVRKKLAAEENIDLLDLEQGVIINIRRTGKYLDAVDVVEVVKEKFEVQINGKMQKVEQIKPRPLTQDESERALKECRDLATVGGFELTKDQIKELTQSSGDPEEIDEIFKRNLKETPAPKTASRAPANDNSKAKTPPKSETAPKSETKASEPAAATTGAGVPESKDQAIQARLAQIKAKKDAEAAAAKAKADAEAAAAVPPQEEENALLMDDEAFLLRFGS